MAVTKIYTGLSIVFKKMLVTNLCYGFDTGATCMYNVYVMALRQLLLTSVTVTAWKYTGTSRSIGNLELGLPISNLKIFVEPQVHVIY